MRVSNKQEIKVVFMDIGGVLLTNGWDHESREKASKAFDFDYEKMTIQHNLISSAFEIGDISMDEYLNHILFYSPRKFTKEAFKQFMYAQSKELPKMLSWLKSWKKKSKLPVFAISNESLELNEYRINKFELQEAFHGFFSSCYLGFRKPDARIFKKALQIAGIAACESIYFDDRLLLVNVAKEIGMHSVQHTDFENTAHILENLITGL